VALIGWARHARQVPATNWLHLPARGILYSEIYVLAGLAALLIAASPALAQRLTTRPDRREKLPAMDGEVPGGIP
jgi:hypothetical protein